MALFSRKNKDDGRQAVLTRAETAAVLNRHNTIMQQFRLYKDDLQKRYDELAKQEEQLYLKQENFEKNEREKLLSIKKEISRLTEVEKDLKQAIQEHRNEMIRAETRSVEYMRRLDAKETALLKELSEKAQKSSQYGNNVPSDGYEFEKYVADILKGNGFENVIVTNASHDYGADVVASKDDISYVFQCKYYSGPVGIDSVQEIFMAKQYYRADVAIVITNSVFTIAAIEAAKETRVKLYDGEKLEALRKRAFGG